MNQERSNEAFAKQIVEIDEVLRGELRHGIGREERQALSWVLTRLQHNLQSTIKKPSPSQAASDADGDDRTNRSTP